MYYQGDLLPENFTHHDKARSIYNSRIGECEVEDPVSAELEPLEPTPITTPLSGGAVIEVPVKEQLKILEVEPPVIQDEVPEAAEAAEAAELTKVDEAAKAAKAMKINEIPKKGTKSADFSLLNKTTPGTSK